MNNGQQSFLMEQQKNIAAIAAQGAAGNIPALNSALQRGLDAGLTINDCREVLVQLYAYAGFPRSLNALTELMSVINTRKAKGINDAEGQLPGPLPEPEDMLKIGTQNQTALVGLPVKGQLFEFAPAADMYLKTHLFGDIFSRDNLDWLNREQGQYCTTATVKSGTGRTDRDTHGMLYHGHSSCSQYPWGDRQFWDTAAVVGLQRQRRPRAT